MTDEEAHEKLRERVEGLAQAVHDARRWLEEEDLVTQADLPGALSSAANTLDWAVDLCEVALIPVDATTGGAS